jgi:ABC-2 type transport system ATP-binding protein/lipopolysaccharide transport system ATP-binding protein
VTGIEISDASVSYYLRHKGEKNRSLDRGAVGGQIVRRRQYLEIEALRNITLSLKQGDRVGLIGLNGSGKSTLLKLCSGALSVQSGSIAIDGNVSAQFSLSAGIRGSLSGRRNAELKCLYMGTPQRSIPDRVEEVKELSQLGGYFELPVSTYSNGMRSRLVMSLIRLVKADILVMDEWLGAADGTVNRKINRLLRDLIESASLMILANHSERVIRQWTNRVVWLDGGVLRAFGPTDEVYPEYTKMLAASVAG